MLESRLLLSGKEFGRNLSTMSNKLRWKDLKILTQGLSKNWHSIALHNKVHSQETPLIQTIIDEKTSEESLYETSQKTSKNNLEKTEILQGEENVPKLIDHLAR